MPITHKLTFSLQANGQNVLSGNQTEVGDLQPVIDVAVPGAITDQAATLAIDVSKLQSLMLMSDKDLKVETNSGSAPADTINLKAGSPLRGPSRKATLPAP